MQIIPKDTDRFLLKTQIGTDNTERTQIRLQMMQSDTEEAQIDTECSRERSARLITYLN